MNDAVDSLDKPLRLYEVVRWGNDQEGGNGKDTIWLVRAENHAKESMYVLCTGAINPQDIAMVMELGIDLGSCDPEEGRVIRGPYLAFAYNHGWKAWAPREDIKSWTWGTECFEPHPPKTAIP